MRGSSLGWILGLVPAGVLFYAAILKGLDPGLFEMQISAHGITPASWSPFLARALVAIELLLACALVLRLRPRWSHLGFIGLMLAFIAATSIAWAHGNAKECGCFGRTVSRGPGHVILQDILLILVSLVSLSLLRRARPIRWGARVGAIAAPMIVAFALLGSRIPADGLVTGVRRGSDLSALPVEDLRKPHTQGWVLLALAGRDCPPCAAGIPELGRTAAERKEIQVALLFSGSRQEAMAFRMEALPAFPVAHASPRALRAYYRTLPAAFLLRDGRLVRAFWGRYPTLDEVASILP